MNKPNIKATLDALRATKAYLDKKYEGDMLEHPLYEAVFALFAYAIGAE
jgi:hypothetical protein